MSTRNHQCFIAVYSKRDDAFLHSGRPGFQRLLQKLDDCYEIPSRKYFTKVAMPALYTSTKEKIAGSLKSAQYYSITTDMWSSGKMEPYLALTVHFVDKEWVLQSHCLQTIFVSQDHTAENLMPVLQGVLESWGLPENRLAFATTNNGTNIVRGFTVEQTVLFWA